MKTLRVTDTDTGKPETFSGVMEAFGLAGLASANIREEIRTELQTASLLLEQAKFLIGVYALDWNEERWDSRGHLFLNGISKWNLDDISVKIERQIMPV